MSAARPASVRDSTRRAAAPLPGSVCCSTEPAFTSRVMAG